MTRCKEITVFAALVLAVAGPLLLAGLSLHNRTAYPVVKFDIEPYDPRDLLYGHYLRFRIKWNFTPEQKTPQCTGRECCLCVGEGTDNPPVYVADCLPPEQRGQTCMHQITGNGWAGQKNFDAGIDRYYVDEKLALPLEKLFRDKKESFSLGLSLPPSGTAAVEKLYIGGKPLESYVQEQSGTIRASEPSFQ